VGELDGSSPEAVVAEESLAANSVRLGRSGGADWFFSADGDSELTGACLISDACLVSDGPSAGTGGSAILLLAANWGGEETLFAVGVGAGDAACVGDC
jgi:hypothetical protein